MTIPRVVKNLAVGGDLLSLADAKAHLRVTSDSEDGYISSLVEFSRSAAENHTGYWFGIYDVEAFFDAVEILPASVLIPETAPPLDPELEYTAPGDVPTILPLPDFSYKRLDRALTVEIPADTEIEPNTDFKITYTTRRLEDGIVANTVSQARLLIIGAAFLNRDMGEVTTPGALWLLDNYRRNQT